MAASTQFMTNGDAPSVSGGSKSAPQSSTFVQESSGYPHEADQISWNQPEAYYDDASGLDAGSCYAYGRFHQHAGGYCSSFPPEIVLGYGNHDQGTAAALGCTPEASQLAWGGGYDAGYYPVATAGEPRVDGIQQNVEMSEWSAWFGLPLTVNTDYVPWTSPWLMPATRWLQRPGDLVAPSYAAAAQCIVKEEASDRAVLQQVNGVQSMPEPSVYQVRIISGLDLRLKTKFNGPGQVQDH